MSEETNGQETSYSYDANRNLLKKSGATANETYEYDVYNRLVSYALDGGAKKETYTYDAEGVRRSKTTVEGEMETEVVFVSDTSNELSRTLAETDEDGNVFATYSWGDTLISQTRAGKTSTYLYDGHGNVRGLLDKEGTLTDTYAYNAYGELIRRTGETENHYLYTGEYYDGTTSLYYLRARYMNPSTGTFISMDTYQGNMYEPVTLHKYLYANANPVKYTDPSGNMSLVSKNVSMAVSSTLQNHVGISMMGLMTAVGNATITAVCGGSGEEIVNALLNGFLVGSVLGVFICSLIIIEAVTMATATALIGFTALGAGLVNMVALSILVLYSVATQNDEKLMIYLGLLTTAFMGTCMAYGAYGEVTVSGDKGSQTITTENVKRGTSSVNNVSKTNPYNLQPTHSQMLSKNKMNILIDDIKNNDISETIKYVDYNGQKYVVDGHHRLIAAKRLGMEQVPIEQVELPYSGYKTIEDLLWFD